MGAGMRELFLLVFSSVFFITYADFAGLYESDGLISVLTASNFSNFVKAQPTFVQFYLHTCGSCQNYAPTFKNLSKSIESNLLVLVVALDWRWAIKLAVIDCADSESKLVRDEYNLSTFPAFMVKFILVVGSFSSFSN